MGKRPTDDTPTSHVFYDNEVWYSEGAALVCSRCQHDVISHNRVYMVGCTPRHCSALHVSHTNLR